MHSLGLNRTQGMNSQLLFICLFVSGFIISTYKINGQQHLSEIVPEAHISFFIKEVESGGVIESYNPDMLMIPASTLKILTTATALEILGKNFQFSTEFYIKGNVEEETLYGDLLIKGGADPTFGSSYFSQNSPDKIFEHIIERLAIRGIAKIKGRILIDESLVAEPRYPAGRLWEDMGNYYGAVPSGLSWRDNTFELDMASPKNIGQLCSVKSMRPDIAGIEFASYVYSAANKKDSAYIYGYPGLTKWEVRGTIPVNKSIFTIKGAIPDPPFQFASELASLLTNQSSDIEIVINNNQVELSNEYVFFTEIRSPFLSEIVKVVNQRSHNLMADHLFFAINEFRDSASDQWTQSALSIVDFWQKQGIYSKVRILDGSGLSPKNLISSHFLVDVICKIDHGNNARVFESSLAIGGKKGTLASMWQQQQWAGRVIGKSGSMEGIMCYAGYIYTSKNRKLAFCLMINNFIGQPLDIRKVVETEIGRIIDEY